MADLFSLLVRTGYSLSAHSAVVATAGNNIANVNTPGYSRQVANLDAAQSINGIGMGVTLDSVKSARDQFVERQLPQALAAQARSQTESDALGAISVFDPSLQGGLTDALGGFYTAMRTVAQNPGDLGLRQAATSAAQTLARAFNQASSSVEGARDGLDGDVAGTVDQINNDASALADLNKQIQIAKTAGGDTPNDLLDSRQKMIDELATLTGASPYTNSAGDVSMSLPSGIVLVSDARAAKLQTVGDPNNGGHYALRLTRSDGTGPVDADLSAFGGKLGGQIAARDGALKNAMTELDGFAFDFGNSINTIHTAGYAMDGTPGQDLFTVTPTATGAAAAITVNPNVAGNAKLLAAATTNPPTSGDGGNLLAIIGTEQQTLAGGNAPVATLQKIIGDFGNDAARAKAFADHDGATADHLTQLRDSASGVSIDEEMVSLTKAQKAFEALSKVISTTDEMLDTLMSLK